MAGSKVTIGVCVKNGEYHIRDVIKSIINQDFPHEFMEVIFVDDGSKDKTLTIINDYASSMNMNVKIFSHEWKGLGYSRNVVVDNANNKYIIWVDCDMRLPRNFVRKQFEFMERHPKVGIGKGKYGVYSEVTLVGLLENIESIIDDYKHHEKSELSSLGTGGSIYRVKAIQQVGGFDSNIRRAGEDTDAEHRISKAGWALCRTHALFYEIRRKTWKGIWEEYFKRGYDGHYVARKNGVQAVSRLYKMFPPTAILSEVLSSFVAYNLTHRKEVFLLPFHWSFKRTAWCLGFILGRLKIHRTVADA